MNRLLDILKINPFSVSASLGSVAEFAIGTRLANENIDYAGSFGVAMASAGITALVWSLKIGRKQIELYNKLDDSIEKRGYDERLFEKVMGTPCGRALTRVLLGNKRMLEKYDGLREKYPVRSLS
jgi:hypothetical protein